MLIEWKNEYSVGHPDLDLDHQNLLDLINTLHRAWVDEEDRIVIEGIFRELMMYTEYHFSREEALLKHIGYAHLDDQEVDHAMLKKQVVDFLNENLNKDTPEKINAAAEEFLKTWMLGHILEEDQKYKKVVQNAPPIAEII
jgi:hemerythrin-like metal-binding protein